MPKFTGQKFTLLPWQKDWLEQLYGWRLPDGRRRWRKVLLTIGKKNGKSLLVSAVCLYELWAAGVPSPLVISCSTTRDNAKQIFGELENSINGNPSLKAKAQVRSSMNLIRFKSKKAEFKSISSEAGNAEGLNLSFACLDEVHAHESPKLFRALEYSTIARPDGCLVMISTAGSDQSHFFYDVLTKGRNVLAGNDLDTSFFSTVYECPEGLEDDPVGWRQANPSLGTSFTEDDFRRDQEAAKAEGMASYQSFRRYRLNQWVQGEQSWLDVGRWDACQGTATEQELAAAPAHLAVDLSSTTDPTSVSVCWYLGSQRHFLRQWAFVCREGVRRRESTNLPRYTQYAAAKEMTITDGDVIDQSLIKIFILDLIRRYRIREIIFDAYNAGLLATELNTVVPTFYFPQNYKMYTTPCKDFERAISERRIVHEGSSLMRWAIQNVRLDVDPQGNCRPSRGKSTDKIDPVISSVMAFARSSQNAAETIPVKSVYSSRPILRF
ncbi:terminase large subunit [Fimbriiglobus ruber]|uniref:Phage terminase large subunit n=1 Tax=Fimbriiglobus ruber TaxID=1908690 RepID=A0A225DP12_9BACT|nr:terminase TerL endonuclease subunit [Fimbriiglobus ruber]OWK37897.1 Phage terminase large subunit [Fimbriiglobus ruber]